MPISTLDLNGNAAGTNANTTFTEQKAVQLFSSATIATTGGTAGRVDSITLTIQGATATESLALDATGLSTATANGVSFSYDAVTGVLTLSGTDETDATWQSILRHIVYNNTSDTPDPSTRTVTVFATDSNSGSSLTRTDTINVVQVNDAPVVDLNSAATGTSTAVSYTENDALKVIAPSAIITDVDSTDFNGGALRVAFTQNGTNADQLSIKTDATVSMSGNVVSVNGTAIGAVSGGANGSDLVVSFNSSAATSALVTLLLQHIGYSNSSDAPSTAARTVKFTMIDGDGTALGGQDTGFATATINVTAANDRPVANNVVANGNEDANSISVKLTGSDVDGTVTSFKVTGPLPDALQQGTLYADSAMTNAVVSGTSYVASSANALTLYFKPTANYNGTVSFNYTATDNSGAEVAASATATINVASVNDAPKIISNGGVGSVTLSVLENTTAVTTVQATDSDSPNLTYSIVGGVDAAKFAIDASGALTFIAAPDFEAPADTLANNSYVVKVQASDGSLADTQTITVKVKNVNEAPVVDLNGAAAPSNSATLAYSANNPLKVIAPSAIVADVDSPNFNGGSLRVSFTQNRTANDQLAIKTDATVTLSGGTVKIGGTTIGTVAGGANGADLVITFTNNNATSARVTTLLEHIGYSNSSPNPPTLTKIVNFALVDGDGGSQDTGIASARIDVTGTNSPAVMAQSATGTLNENLAGPVTIAALSATDADASDNSNGSFNGLFQFAAGGIDNSKFQIVGNALQYTGPALNFENGANQHSFEVKVQANDGESLSNVQTLTVTLHDVNEAPTVVSFANPTTALDENIDTSSRIKVADIVVSDDALGSETLTLSGADAGFFEIDGTGLYLKAGVALNFEAKASYGVTVNADDPTVGGSPDASQAFTLTVNDVNEAPTVANPIADQNATEDSAFSFVVPANTFHDAYAGDHLTYKATLADDTALPGWLHFNAATGAFSGTPLNPDVATIQVKVTATDDSNASVSDTFDIVVGDTNDAPTVTGSIAVQPIRANDAFSLTIPGNLFTDVDVGDHLTITAGTPNGGTLPSWLSYDSNTGIISGTPSATDAGLVQLTLTATDIAGASASILLPVVVVDQQAIVGTPNDDNLTGTVGGDTIYGLEGNDKLDGSAGADYVDGGAGNDNLTGGNGADVLVGGDGSDQLSDGSSNDVLQGGAGDDSLILSYSGASQSLTQVADGGEGNNSFSVSNTTNPLISYQLTAGSGNDNFNVSGVGHFTIDAGSGVNSFYLSNYIQQNSSSGTFSGGTGKDNIYMEGYNLGSWTFDLGADNDVVTLYNYSYYITGNHNFTIYAGDGNDTISADGLGSQNSSAPVAVTIDGGAGDDIIYAPYGYGLYTQIAITAGDGNDTIYYAGTSSQATFDAGAGNDVIQLSAYNATTLTLGSGSDQINIQGWSGSSSAAATIADFATGAGGDRIDLSAIWNAKLVGWDGSANPFGAGFAQFVQDGDDSLLQIDVDGAGNASSYQTLLRIQNHAASDFTIDNFNPPYPTDGSLPAGQTISGTPNDDNLTGTVGGDTIYGLEGNDKLDGSAGADYVDGGAGNDNLTGGNGADVLVGGDGSDQLSDGSSNDVLQGGAGDDSLILSYSGASQSLTQVADGGEGNNSFSVSNTTNPLISYQLTAGSGNDNFNVSGVGHFTIDAGSGVNSFYLSNYIQQNSSSGTFSGGTGKDNIYMEGYNLGSWTFDLGADNDVVTLYNYSYYITGNHNFTIYAGDGNDTISADGLGSQNSSAPVAVTIDGGAGDDIIYAPYGYGLYTQIAITAGDGNDTIYYAGTSSQATFDAGAGNDVIQLSAYNATTLTLGSGSDQINIQGWSGSSSAAATIADFATGAGGDRIDLSAIWNAKLVGWDGSANPFGAGFAQFVQDGDDSLLQIDVDGAGNASSYQTLLRIQNHAASDFTIDNFNPPYPTDGSLPAGQTISGTPNDDNLTGTVGGDTIYGLEGNDKLDGSAGADYVDGGAGNDNLTGGNGADVLVGGDGSDQLSDGSSNDVLQGGAGDDSLILSYSGASQSLTQVADGGEGNNSFSVSNTTNPLISYQLTAGSGNDNFNVSGVGHFTIDAGSGVNSFYLSNYIQQNSSSGTFSGGTGKDNIYMEGYNLGSWTFDLGADNDVVTLYNYSYYITGNHNFTIYAGDGNDTISADGLGSQNSSAPVAVTIDGGAGDDIIYAPYGYGLYTQIAITAGDGNDTIYYAGTSSQATFDAGAGNDVIQLSAYNATTLTLGSGSDQINIQGWSGSSSAAATIADFATGAGGDRIDLSAIWNAKLVGWDGSANPFGAGFAQFVQDGDDSLLQIDVDGAGNASSYQTLLRIQNHAASDFTIDNFNPPYPTDGSGIAGQNPAGSGTIIGTIGDDTITGSSGVDILNGGSGADHLVGGAGPDTLIGGFGADTFVFNDPSDGLDIITDFVSGANTPAGDHLEMSASGFGHGLTAGGAAPLVTAADAASASNQGSDGYFIFDNVGPNAGTVYWDSTGGSGTDAAALVVLTGVNSLQASDFHLV